MPPLLQLKDVTLDFPAGRGRAVHALAGVSLQIDEGQTLGLVGESGCGKTSLGRCALGLLRPTDGHVLFEGARLDRLSGAALRKVRRRMQYIFQDPQASLDPRMTVERVVSEPLEVHRLIRGRQQRRRRVSELLEQVELSDELLDRYPHELSGGQRQRVATARALASQPRFMVADEPTSSLDVPIRAQILDLLGRLQRDTGLAYLLISHDLPAVRRMAHQVAVMYLGRVVEQGPADRVCRDPLHPYTRALVAAEPRLPGPAAASAELNAPSSVLQGEIPSPTDPPDGCPFHPRCPVYREREGSRCAEALPALRATEQGDHLVACHEVQTGPREGT